MHPRLKHIIILFFTLCPLNGADADSIKSYLWGLIQFSSDKAINYEPGYWKDQILFRREFHEPVTFLPAEIRYGVFFYGGVMGGYLKSNWVNYEKSVFRFFGGSIKRRSGLPLGIGVFLFYFFFYFFNKSTRGI